VTVWGELCHLLNAKQGMIVAFKNCRVSDFNGKSLSASSSASDIVLDAPHPRKAQIQQWYNSLPHDQILKKISPLTE
jgi:hypothetical protein